MKISMLAVLICTLCVKMVSGVFAIEVEFRPITMPNTQNFYEKFEESELVDTIQFDAFNLENYTIHIDLNHIRYIAAEAHYFPDVLAGCEDFVIEDVTYSDLHLAKGDAIIFEYPIVYVHNNDTNTSVTVWALEHEKDAYLNLDYNVISYYCFTNPVFQDLYMNENVILLLFKFGNVPIEVAISLDAEGNLNFTHYLLFYHPREYYPGKKDMIFPSKFLAYNKENFIDENDLPKIYDPSLANPNRQVVTRTNLMLQE